jgi:uncharacterized membrane protein
MGGTQDGNAKCAMALSPSTRLRAALVFLVLWFGVGGLAHFVFTDAQMRIVPPWVPWPRAAVLVSGVFELLGAAGLLRRETRAWAAWGLFALTLAVTPANVHMLQQASDFPGVPVWLLVARLPLQVALLALLAWVAWRSRLRG